MNFKEAYEKMREGKKVRRKDWLGYWFIEDGKVKIYLKDGNIKFNNFTQETIVNTLAEDWEVVEEQKSKDWKPKKVTNIIILVIPDLSSIMDSVNIEIF